MITNKQNFIYLNKINYGERGKKGGEYGIISQNFKFPENGFCVNSTGLEGLLSR